MKYLALARSLLAIPAFLVLGIGSANATVTAAFSLGTSCGGPTSANFSPGGSTITVSL
jgi:hypothetical protein